MDSMNLMVVLKVADLQKCKNFYRDILGLGAPVTDSTNWVEFFLGKGRSLCLEHAPEIQKTDSVPLSWMISSEDPDGVSERYSAAGYTGSGNVKDLFGHAVREFTDPEGNLFYVQDEKMDEE